MSIQNHPERLAKWQSLIEDQEKSGLSQKEFCKNHDLVLSQFVYYRATLKRDKAMATELFSPIQIKKVERNISVEIKIILPNGFQCVVPSLLESSHLKNLMGALLSC